MSKFVGCMIISAIAILLFIAYSVLIFYYRQSWNAMPSFITNGQLPETKISVIVAARNEEDNIEQLLQSIKEQSYPGNLFEVIVVDDHSTDNSADKVKRFAGVKLLQLKEDAINSYKKKAIETGIAAASGDWIITTDADCIVPPDWLKILSVFQKEKNAVFIAAPVMYDCDSSVLQIFQTLDFLVLQGIAAASAYSNFHSMCNGANLAYQKKSFYAVNGFTGIEDIASGDDMLLMHKIAKQFPGRIHYLKSKDAIVTTHPMKTWKEFFNQRIRWASKAKRYDDKRISRVLLLVYLFNFSFIALLVAGCWYYHYWYYLAGLWIGKTIVEFPFVYPVAAFFKKQQLMKYFFFFQPIHILYTVVAGMLGQTGKYDWKGRRVK